MSTPPACIIYYYIVALQGTVSDSTFVVLTGGLSTHKRSIKHGPSSKEEEEEDSEGKEKVTPKEKEKEKSKIMQVRTGDVVTQTSHPGHSELHMCHTAGRERWSHTPLISCCFGSRLLTYHVNKKCSALGHPPKHAHNHTRYS